MRAFFEANDNILERKCYLCEDTASLTNDAYYNMIFYRLTLVSLILWLYTIPNVVARSTTKYYSYIVEARYPHKADSYTQGLQIVDGELFESTGLYGGESRLLKVDIASGETQLLATLPTNHFGEGITILGDTVYMLTWQENTMHMFDKKSGKKIDQRLYAGEGWGLTSDGDKLYMSNGSSSIIVRDRESFETIGRHTVTLNGRPIDLLNELEWINGRIWANVYSTDQIVIINPTSWQIEGIADLTGLLPTKDRTEETDVLNGIAYDKDSDKIYVTGKMWNAMFQIKLVEKYF